MVHRREVLIRLSLILFGILSVCCLLLTAELITRQLFEIKGVQLRREWDRVYRFDSELGWTADTNNEEFGTDELGFRRSEGEESAAHKILILGDSSTWGWEIPADQTFTSHLNGMFSQCRFINGGMIGYSTIQEYLLLRRVVEDIRPDVVIVMSAWSDFHENTQNSFDYPRPYATLVDGAIIIPNVPIRIPFWKRAAFEISKRSSLFNLLAHNRDGEELMRFRRRMLDVKGVKLHMDNSIEIMHQSLLLIRDMLLEHNIRLVVVLQPQSAQIFQRERPLENDILFGALILAEQHSTLALSNGSEGPEVVDYILQGGPVGAELEDYLAVYRSLILPIEDKRYIELVRWGATVGLPVFDMTSPLYDRFREQNASPTLEQEGFYRDIAHPGVAGHKALAGIIAEIALDSGLLPEECQLREPGD